MMARGSPKLWSKGAFWGFLLLIACFVSASSVPVDNPSSTGASSESTPVALVTSEPDAGRPAPKEPEEVSSPDDATDVREKGYSEGDASTHHDTDHSLPVPALEVVDLLKDPYHHNTSLSSPGNGEEVGINNETVIVVDPHVTPINKTHEEEGKTHEEEAKTHEEGAKTHEEEAKTHEEEAKTQDEAKPIKTLPETVASNTTPQAPEQPLTPAAPAAGGDTVQQDKQAGKGSQDAGVGEELPKESSEKATEIDAELTSPPVSALVSLHDVHDHPAMNKTTSYNHTTQAAAILAGVLVLIALLGYLGLLVWRRMLERRYGNRQMLVNDDEDFKHFEL